MWQRKMSKQQNTQTVEKLLVILSQIYMKILATGELLMQKYLRTYHLRKKMITCKSKMLSKEDAVTVSNVRQKNPSILQ